MSANPTRAGGGDDSVWRASGRGAWALPPSASRRASEFRQTPARTARDPSSRPRVGAAGGGLRGPPASRGRAPRAGRRFGVRGLWVLRSAPMWTRVSTGRASGWEPPARCSHGERGTRLAGDACLALTERRLCHGAARPAWGCVSVKSCYKVKGGGGGLRPQGRAQQRRQGGGRDAAAGPALRFPGRLGEPGAVTGRGPGSPAASLPPLPPALS